MTREMTRAKTTEPDDTIAVPPLKVRRAKAVRRLGLIPAPRPIRVWQDSATGQICFRAHRKRRVLRRTLAELWDLVNGQGVML